ncbi:uncharacterized protein LOC114435882 isoform X2 [Parambassis ranga]|uniref:Uncharacterized protein LOC114435882 isoform X2 n=1 Tax=Parambassis ranga TaxID=210632 RepID=A0A6P7I760_9TELE|nr:uncharacterized protein LOC114435882 isoform X2 [Parambassis ranga]
MDMKVFLLLGLIGLVSCDLPFKRTCSRDPEDPNTRLQPTECTNYKNIEYIYKLYGDLEGITNTLNTDSNKQKQNLSQLMEDFRKMKEDISETNKTQSNVIATLKNKVSYLEAQNQILSENFNQIERRLDESQNQLMENKGKLQKLEAKTEAAFNDTKELLRLYKSELSNLNTTARNLLLRLEAQLTAEVEKIKNTDKALEAKLTEQKGKIDELGNETNKKIKNVEDRLTAHNNTVNKHTTEIETLNIVIAELKLSLQTKSIVDAILKGEVDKLKAAVNTWQKVAFSASIIEGPGVFTGPKTGSSSTLIFNNVFTNIGNAYNSQTGIFTAPVKGVYQFTFMTFGYSSYTSGAILVKNGIYQVSTWEFQGPDYSDTTSNTVILQLNQDETVNIILWQGGKIHTAVFSGFLLFTV